MGDWPGVWPETRRNYQWEPFSPLKGGYSRGAGSDGIKEAMHDELGLGVRADMAGNDDPPTGQAINPLQERSIELSDLGPSGGDITQLGLDAIHRIGGKEQEVRLGEAPPLEVPKLEPLSPATSGAEFLRQLALEF